MKSVVHLDFELASEIDLGDVGADVWTKSPKTIPLLAGFAIDADPPLVIAFDQLGGAPSTDSAVVGVNADALLFAINEGAEIHAWNANFEFQVWNNICAPRFGWPALPIEKFHCTMASAACAGLPMSLDDAAVALNAPHRKNKPGQALMLRMARPRGFNPDGSPRWWHVEDPFKRAALIAYNRTDVEAERAVSALIPRMTKREREIWLADQRMNQRGLPVDPDLLLKLHEITFQEQIRLGQEIFVRTHGDVNSATQNKVLLEWVQERGYPYDSLAKDTLTAFLSSKGFEMLPIAVRAVLESRAEAAKTSTAKLKSIAGYASHDGVARNLVQYGGAVRTLRWAGRGPQIQNFPRPVVKHVEQAIEAILGGADADTLRWLYGRPLDVVSSCLKGVFKAPEGHKMAICDYSAIEAIVLAWLAKFEDLLDVFRRREDVYIFTARGIGSNNRQLGKVLRLACGYGMGGPKFQDTANAPPNNMGLTLAEAVNAVKAFREANRPIVSLWYACENHAKAAINDPGASFQYDYLKFRMARDDGRLKGALLMELPSGRNLVYRNARIEQGRIVYWGVNQYTRQWEELDTYGGKLAENATQAIARDLLADAVVELDGAFPGTLRTTVHDEIVGITEDDRADELFRAMKMVMSTAPEWGKGLPLSAAGGIAQRYGKL